MVADPRSNLETSIQTAINSELMEVHTCMPGEIVSFDPVEQTADIQLSIKSKQSGKVINRALLESVPIRYLKNSELTITIPVKEGDPIWVMFSERSIDTWLENGGIQDPADIRKHSLSDAFAFPMVYSQVDKIPDFDNSNLQIRTLDGNAKITIKPTGAIDIETTGKASITSSEIDLNGDADSVIAFTDMKTAFDTLKSDHNSHTHTDPQGGATGPPITPSTADMSGAEVPTVKVP